MMNNPTVAKTNSTNTAVFRWLALGGVIMPIVFVAAFTIAGLIRTGYSPVSTAISALGVGHNAWMEDVPACLLGLGVIGFTVSFAHAMRGEMSNRSRLWATVLLTIFGLVWVTVSIFTSKPSTRQIHTLASVIGEAAVTAAFFVVASGLKRSTSWRNFAAYSRAAGFVTLALVILALLTSSKKRAGSGAYTGLTERAMVIEALVWFVAFGCLLFAYWRVRSKE